MHNSNITRTSSGNFRWQFLTLRCLSDLRINLHSPYKCPYHTQAAVVAGSMLPPVATTSPSLVTPFAYAVNNNSSQSRPWPDFNLETEHWVKSSNGPEIWHLDTSATHHFSPHFSQFSSHESAKSSDLVRLGKGSSQLVQNFGHGKNILQQ